MARVYGEDDRPAPGDRLFLRIERPIYRTCRVDPNREQRWTVYAYSVANARLQAPRVADERASISRR
jgi:K+-transporting ATPase A subunit